ncbi:protogenin [Papilio machaon]|uniref:protogenin n=1 Tax=Papilio machaon TaxID=76193 RepID=UPI001E662CF6|nr:protogenin [Papilio machaon]
MALILLQVLVLGVTAAAVDDVPVRWVGPARQWLACEAAGPRRAPPPPLIDDDRHKHKPYFWRRDGEKLDYKRVSTNGSLEVFHKRDVEGVYQCGVHHHRGIVLGKPVHLKFAYMDKQFSRHPENMTVPLRQPAALSCGINSGPPPLISWLRDGEDLPRDPRYHILETQLLIMDVTPEDAGTYKCIATNQLANRSRVSYSGSLQVVASDDREPGLLEVHHAAQFVTPRGTDVELLCPVLGWPRPKLTWRQTPPGERPRELESTTEVLVLRNLQADQEGFYTCEVDGLPQLIKSFNVSIFEPVTVSLVPASKEVLRASTVRFNCSVTGKPEPRISWYKDGQPLTLAGRINLRSSADVNRMQLVISGVTSDDAGVYQCVAQCGGAGRWAWSSAWAALNVTGAWAAAPGALRCLPAGPRRVALRWLPAAEKVVAYTVDTTPRDGPGISITGQPQTGTEQVITLKEPLTPYFFQVRAYIPSSNKKNVASDMSESVVCQGQGVPVRVSRSEGVSGGVSVSWRQFAREQPGVVQWVLQHKPDNATLEHNITLPGHVTNYTLLADASTAWVRVLGSRNLTWLPQDLCLLPWTSTASADLSPYSEAGPVPERVRVSGVGGRGFAVQWQCARCEGVPDIAFRVCFRNTDGDGEDDCQESYKSSATVEGLEPGSEYEVRVQAVSVGGRPRGAFSDPVRVTTQPEGPGLVGELSYAFVNATSVRVRWRGAAARYTVRYCSRLRLPVEQWDALTTLNNTALITGLEPTEQMYVMVTGHEPQGHSRILTIPAQFKDLEAKELKYVYTRNGVRVWWEEGGGGSGARVVRVVRYAQNITRPVEHWHARNVSDMHVELEDLDPSLPVYVMVTLPGPDKPNQVLTIPPRPHDNYNLYLSVGVGVGVCVLCAAFVAAACIWKKYKNRSRLRSRRNQHALEEMDEGSSEMKMGAGGSGVGGRLANGGACGEPLLNGHLRPHQHSKTPNGKVKKAHLYEVFDVSREEGDVTVETVLEDGPAYSLLDTSRRPEHETRPPTREPRPHKLPDDNMNSELNRTADSHLDTAGLQPTLQPNG